MLKFVFVTAFYFDNALDFLSRTPETIAALCKAAAEVRVILCQTLLLNKAAEREVNPYLLIVTS